MGYYFETWHDKGSGVAGKPQMRWALRQDGSDIIYAESGYTHDSIGDFDWWLKHMWKDFKEAAENPRKNRDQQ